MSITPLMNRDLHEAVELDKLPMIARSVGVNVRAPLLTKKRRGEKLAIISPFRGMCAHVVDLCTGSLRLLHQPRSPAARLVSSQVVVKGDDVGIQYLVSRPSYPGVRVTSSMNASTSKVDAVRGQTRRSSAGEGFFKGAPRLPSARAKRRG